MKKNILSGNKLQGLKIIFVLSALIWIAIPFSEVTGQPPGEEASPVAVGRVVSKSVRPIVTLFGTARPHRKSVVSPEVEGVVTAFPAKKGQKVKKGQVLARVETRPFLFELKIANANLAEAKVNHENAISELKRVAALFKKKSISSRAYDDALRSANALEKQILALKAKIETIQYHIDLSKTRNALEWNFVLALIITFLLMAALFENFFYPLVIMFSVPLAAAGGFLGLWLVNAFLSNQPLDILTMLGFVIFVGIVVNNAILIVHQLLNFIRKDKMDFHAAIKEAVQVRIRPIYEYCHEYFRNAPSCISTGRGI